MGLNQHSIQAVVVPIHRGYAIVAEDELDRISARFELIDRIANCTTWGDYRSLGNHELEDYVSDHVHFKEELDDDGPADDEPFSVNLRDVDQESSFLDQDAALESATGDFLNAIKDEGFPREAVGRIGPWSFVTDSHLEAVCAALAALGYVLRYDAEGL